MLSLGTLASLMPSNGEDAENMQEEESLLKNKASENSIKMSDFLAENKFDKPALEDSLNEVLKKLIY